MLYMIRFGHVQNSTVKSLLHVTNHLNFSLIRYPVSSSKVEVVGITTRPLTRIFPGTAPLKQYMGPSQGKSHYNYTNRSPPRGRSLTTSCSCSNPIIHVLSLLLQKIKQRQTFSIQSCTCVQITHAHAGCTATTRLMFTSYSRIDIQYNYSCILQRANQYNFTVYRNQHTYTCMPRPQFRLPAQLN